MLQRGQGKLVQRVIARLVLNAKCLPPNRNYRTRQCELKYRLTFRNNLHIAGIKQFHKELVNWEIKDRLLGHFYSAYYSTVGRLCDMTTEHQQLSTI